MAEPVQARVDVPRAIREAVIAGLVAFGILLFAYTAWLMGHYTLQTGNRDIIRCSLADVLMGRAKPRDDAHHTTIFSPFGLGILDLAVSKLVRDLACASDSGTVIPSFLPDSFRSPA